MAKKKKKIKPVENPFDLNIKEQVKKTFTIDQNAKAPKPGQMFPGSIITGIRDIFNLPAMAVEAVNRAQLNLTGNGDQPTKPLYKFTTKNVVNGMEALNAPYRRLIAEPTVYKLIMAQEVLRNPRAYWNNPSALYELSQKAYERAQGDRTGLEWYRDPKNPVTLGQAVDAVLKNPLNSKEIPSLLDVDAVNRYYVYDPRSEYMDLVNPTPGKTASGALDFAAVMFFDPLNFIPGSKVAKAGQVAKTTEKTAMWSREGLKQLTPENFRELAAASYNSGREDIGEFAILLEEMGTEGAGKLIDNYIFYGTPEFEETAALIKNTFEEYDTLATKLPGEDIPPITELNDVKYFVADGDAWAATDSTILQWIRPYVNSKGAEVEGYWRESALFPRGVVERSQANAVEKFEETVTRLVKEGEAPTDFTIPGKNIKVAEGITFDNPYLGSAFENSLAAIRPDLAPGGAGLSGTTIPTNAFELPIFDFVSDTLTRTPLKSANVDFAVFHIGGKKVVTALDRKTGTIYTLDSYRPTIIRKADAGPEDVLARAEQMDDSILPASKLPAKEVQRLLTKIKNGTATQDELDLYKRTVGDRYLSGDVTPEELATIEKTQLQRVTSEEEVNEPIDYAEEFFELFNQNQSEMFDEFDDFSSQSAFPDSIQETPSLNVSKTFSGNRQLVWVKQSGFDLSNVDGYEMAFYSPFDGKIMTGIVPSDFVVTVPSSSGVEGIATLPQLRRIGPDGNLTQDQVYSFDVSGTLTTLADAKSSFARLKEMLIKSQMEVADLQRAKLQSISKIVERGEDGIIVSVETITRDIASLRPSVIGKEKQIASLRERVRRLEELTPEEENLLRLANRLDRMQERLDNLTYARNIVDNLPNTPQEIGFWWKTVQTDNGVELSLVKRTLDWDSFGTEKVLKGKPVDEVIGNWKLTNAQLKQLNFRSVQNGGYSTDWDLFKQINSGDENIYAINAKEVEDWGTKKSFRLRDYRRKLNELRRARGAQVVEYEEGSIVNYKEFRLEQLRAEWFNLHKQKQHAEKLLARKDITEKNRNYTRQQLQRVNEQLEEVKRTAAADEELIDTVIASGGTANVEITPAMWQAIYGQPPKLEIYLDRFLKTLNEMTGTSTTLMDKAIRNFDVEDVYPLADEWSDTPMSLNVADGPIPEEVLDAMNALETPEIKINYGDIKSDPNGIFVFGSNLQGIHGAGAAKTAAVEYGAERGVGEGLTGRSYALPTKKGPYENMSIEEVAKGIERFIQFAKDNPNKIFYVTSFGTKRAGFTPEQIAQLFDEIPNNVVFTNEPNGSKNILGQAIENSMKEKGIVSTTKGFKFKPKFEEEFGNYRLSALDPETGSVIGYITWDKSSGKVDSVEVNKELRRKGIATELLNQAKIIARNEGFPEIKEGSVQTDYGRAWRNSVEGRPSRGEVVDQTWKEMGI